MKYKNKEFISLKELQSNLEKYLDYLLQSPLNRLVIVRDGKKEVVMIPLLEYEHIKGAAEIVEMQEIANIVKARKGQTDRIPHEEILKLIENRLKKEKV